MANRAGLSVSATYGVYPCADGWVYVTAFAPALWDRFKKMAPIPELDEERFATQEGRLEHNDELQAILTGWTLTKTSEELREAALRGDPVTVAETTESLLHSEQWSKRGVVRRVEHPVAGEISILGPPWLDPDAKAPAPAPRLGEANEELLAPLVEAGN